MTPIRCCKGCVAPKRYPGCHGHCPEYLQEKEAYEKLKAEKEKQYFVGREIYRQRSEKVTKAMKNRRR